MLSFAFASTDLASSRVSFIRSVNLLTASTLDGGWCSSKPIWGFHPVSSRKGVCCIKEWMWSIYENSARGSRECQSSCHSLMKSHRYCSSSWLTHLVCLSVWGLVFGLDWSQVPNWVPDLTPVHNPYPSYSGTGFNSGLVGNRVGCRVYYILYLIKTKKGGVVAVMWQWQHVTSIPKKVENSVH